LLKTTDRFSLNSQQTDNRSADGLDVTKIGSVKAHAKDLVDGICMEHDTATTATPATNMGSARPPPGSRTDLRGTQRPSRADHGEIGTRSMVAVFGKGASAAAAKSV
jgi:hypothetical protein